MNLNEFLTYDFSSLTIALASASAAAFIIALVIWLAITGKIRRKVNNDNNTPMPADEAFPDVSVVVYANNHGANIEALINDIFAQDYPGQTEVIVVNDGSYDNTEDIIGRLELSHSNLYMTYAPENSRNLSRRKLSITLGVKAARYDVVALLHGNCRITSTSWLRMMARHFCDGKEIVAGYSHPAADNDTSGAMRVRAFDREYQAMAWLSAGIDGRLLRADGHNLAYTRRLFFANKGFSRSLNLNFGDDDIFINEIATPHNCAVELSSDSMVEYSEATPVKAHVFEKQSRKFTSRYTGKPFVRRIMGVGCWMWWIAAGCGVAAAITALPSLIPAAGMLLLTILAWCLTGSAWRRTCRAIADRQLAVTSIPLMMWHPIYEIYYAIRSRRGRRKNFTWTN